MSDQLYEEWRAACDKVVELTVQNTNMQENLTDLEAQVAELRQAVSLHWEQKLDAHVESADRRLWALIDKGEV